MRIDADRQPGRERALQPQPQASRACACSRSGACSLRDPGAKDGDLDVGGIRQPMHVGAIAYGPAFEEQWGVRASRPVDFFDVKGDVEDAARAAAGAVRDGDRIRRCIPGAVGPDRAGRQRHRLDRGTASALAAEVRAAGPPVLFELDLRPLLAAPLPRYAEVSKFPPVIRDLAVIVDEAVPARCPAGGPAGRPARRLVQEVRMFDLYRGEGVGKGRKSLAFRVVMQDTARTLTDAEVDAAMAQLRAASETSGSAQN